MATVQSLQLSTSQSKLTLLTMNFMKITPPYLLSHNSFPRVYSYISGSSVNSLNSIPRTWPRSSSPTNTSLPKFTSSTWMVSVTIYTSYFPCVSSHDLSAVLWSYGINCLLNTSIWMAHRPLIPKIFKSKLILHCLSSSKARNYNPSCVPYLTLLQFLLSSSD